MENNIWRSLIPVILWISVMTAVLGAAFLAQNFTQFTPTFFNVERDIGLWLTANSDSNDVIMSTIVLKDRLHVPIPTPSDTSQQAPTLLDIISQEMPTFIVSSRSQAWHYVTGTPWFKERYQVVAQFGQEGHENTAVPYTIWQYIPNLEPADHHNLRVNVDNRFNLLRADFSPESIRPGDPVRVTLYYEAQQPLDRPFTTVTQLISPLDGRAFATRDTTTPHSTPLTWWEQGQIISESFTMTTTPDIPIGAYRVNVAMRHAESVDRWPMYVGQDANPVDQITVGYVAVPAWEPLPLTTQPVQATFEDNITLHSYHLEGEAVPGKVLTVFLHWEGNYPTENYQVFVHLLNDAGQLVAGHDGPPQAGQYPTQGWRTGDIVWDGHLLTLDSTVPPGAYTLKAGLYHPTTLERLPVTLADGTQPLDTAVLLGTITLEK